MSQSYVIMAPYWDYNDEYSYTVGEGAGSPVAVFTNREAADKRCEELEIEAWRSNLAGESIGAWMYDSYKEMGQLSEEEAIEKLKAAFPPEDGEDDVEIDVDDFVVPADVTDEQIGVLREVFGWLYFNHVVEVESE